MLQHIPVIIQASAAILIGFIGLVWSADRFVAGSASIAKSFGIAPLVIGLTIVSFGTSAPEVLVSINAALNGIGELAIGNALGSNIANIGLVLGCTTLVAAIPVQKHILRHEIPVLLAVTFLGGVFLYDSKLVFFEGVILLLAIIPTMFYLIKKKQAELNAGEIREEEDIPDLSRQRAIFWFLTGLILLVFSSDILVWGAKICAEYFGVSPLIVGLTVIAVGTSLPELAASIMSALKGHHDIALGNIVGSNIFNLLAVMGIPGLIETIDMEPSAFTRDFATMAGMTALIAVAAAIALKHSQSNTTSQIGAKLGRVTGLILLSCYIAYYVIIFAST